MTNLPERRICGAQLRGKPGRYCQKSPVNGRKRCRLHGGATPRGIDASNWKGRGYSVDIPTRYLQRIDDVLEDPELAGMRHELALVDARMGELLARLTAGNSVEAWSKVAEITDRLDATLASTKADDPEKLVVCHTLSDQLRETLATHRAEAATWNELYETIDLRRRISQAETKREVDLSGNLTARQAATLIAAIRLAITEVVIDDAMRTALNSRIFSQILNRPPLPGDDEAAAEYEIIDEGS